MLRLQIDGRDVEVEDGTTVLGAADRLGIVVPTLCHEDGLPPLATCMVCLVEESASGRLLPACSTRAAAGMAIETASPRAVSARRAALELLLSEHAGDCEAPCVRACPLGLDVGGVLDALAEDRPLTAWARLREVVALPASAARLCRHGCEKACRRRQLDGRVGVAAAHAELARWGLECGAPPVVSPRSGRRMIVVGAGPAGLAAADALLARGHDCTLVDAHDRAGGSLRVGLAAVGGGALADLDCEIGTILGRGVETRLGVRVGEDVAWSELRRQADVVVVATGGLPAGLGAEDGTVLALTVDLHERARSVVHAMACGRRAALEAHARLTGERPPLAGSPARLTGLTRDELLALERSRARRLAPVAHGVESVGLERALAEARRCLGCGCSSAGACALRRLALQHEVEPGRFAGRRRAVEEALSHPLGWHEAGKCVLCGRCVRVTEQAREPLGLAVTGRGFESRVRVPLGGRLDALGSSVADCAAACPTGAFGTCSTIVGAGFDDRGRAAEER